MGIRTVGAIRVELRASISKKPCCQWSLEKWAPSYFMRTAGCPGETFKSHCWGSSPECITLSQLPGWDDTTGIQPPLTIASLSLLQREDTPELHASFLWRKQSPMRGPPPGTQKVCTVPSLPTIWGHGGGGNKVTFQRFLVQQRKANAVVIWVYCPRTVLFPEPGFPARCHLLSPAPHCFCPPSELHG